jgi:shikimate kinase
MSPDKILAALRKDIQRQESPLGPGKIIILTGAPCVGKTTIGKALAEKYHLHFVMTDQFRKHFKESEMFAPGTNELVLDLFLKHIRFLCKNGQSVVCEGIFNSPERVSRINKALKNFDQLWIQLTAPYEVLITRLKERNSKSEKNHPGSGQRELSVATLNEFYTRSSEVSTGLHVIENTGIDIVEPLDKIIILIERSLVIPSSYETI